MQILTDPFQIFHDRFSGQSFKKVQRVLTRPAPVKKRAPGSLVDPHGRPGDQQDSLSKSSKKAQIETQKLCQHERKTRNITQ